MIEPDEDVLGSWPVYVDSSAIVKVYLPESDSDRVDRMLRGRTDLVISELVVTEIISSAARRMREGTLSASDVRSLQRTILSDVESQRVRLVDLRSSTHREAERILITVRATLRAADSLHLALALESECRTVMTFDARLAAAAEAVGLDVAPEAW